MSCHGSAAETARGRTDTSTIAEGIRVLLVGGPNVGKSTLFNALTGARQHTVNAPGTTVELATGTWRTAGPGGGGTVIEREIVDLPGSYSLLARSADEQVTADAVADLAHCCAQATGRPGVVVVVLDATALARSLYLLAQVAETGVPLVVALTMLDLAATATDSPTAAAHPDSLAAALAASLGVPVIAVDARNRAPAGMATLAGAVDDVAAHPQAVIGIAVLQPSCDPGSTAEVPNIPIPNIPIPNIPIPTGPIPTGPIPTGPPADPPIATGPPADHPIADHPVVHAPVVHAPQAGLGQQLAHAQTLFAWVEAVVEQLDTRLAPGSRLPEAATSRPGLRRTFSDRVDTVLLNPWAGTPVFAAVVWLLFELTTMFAAPLQALIGGLVNGPLASGVTWLLGLVGLGDSWVRGLLVDGLLVGVGTVATFLPVMAIMFAALGVLEDCGYLARAAFVADKAMRSLGLDGRALLPLIVGFGCNLPALAATRILPHARQRLLTGLLIPLTSCSARLTVYVLLASTFFPAHAGTVIFLMYLASVALVLVGGLALRATAFRDVRAQPLILVLPPYQRPHIATLAMSVRLRVGSFVMRAGKIIVVTMCVVWALMAIPVTGQHSIGEVPVADSLYGAVASGIAPVLAPAGFGNDHAAAALMTGFVAKEVVVGSFAQSYAVAKPADAARAGSLGQQLRASFAQSSRGHGGPAALAFMVFVLAYTPCVAALAEQRRLFGWRPTLSALGVQLAGAWTLSVLVFQIGSWA